MQNDIQPIESIQIESKIIMLRGKQVMIDRDLAELYGVETKRLNEQVRRNIERFRKSLCFSWIKKNLKIGGRNLRPPMQTKWD